MDYDERKKKKNNNQLLQCVTQGQSAKNNFQA
jgi:hypothetical protein